LPNRLPNRLPKFYFILPNRLTNRLPKSAQSSAQMSNNRKIIRFG
jgi:hypothetical protein